MVLFLKLGNAGYASHCSFKLNYPFGQPCPTFSSGRGLVASTFFHFFRAAQSRPLFSTFSVDASQSRPLFQWTQLSRVHFFPLEKWTRLGKWIMVFNIAVYCKTHTIIDEHIFYPPLCSIFFSLP